jgi:DNA primase
VLADYGYQVGAGGSGEQQFPCDLHGDGYDNKPSARVYPASKSWYCFACDLTRDAIQTVRDKEGVEFYDALRILEKRYGLSPLPREPGDGVRPPTAQEEIRAALNPAYTFDDDVTRLRKFLDGLTSDRLLPMRALLGMWEAYDKVCYLVRNGNASENTGREALDKIRQAALKRLEEASKEG